MEAQKLQPVSPVSPVSTKIEKVGRINTQKIFKDVFTDNFDVVAYQPPATLEDLVPNKFAYSPDPRPFKRLCKWWSYKPSRPIWLHGHSGSGKTEMLQYLAANVRSPVAVMQGNADTRAETLFVVMQAKGENGGTTLVPIPSDVVIRYRDGGLLIIDEIDKFDIAVQAALFALCDLKPIYVQGIGLVYPNRFTKIAATANTVGDGASMHYTSSTQVDVALRSRFFYLQVDYPTAEVEHSIILAHFPALDKNLVKFTTNIVAKLRKSFSEGLLTMPFSPRTHVGLYSAIEMIGWESSFNEVMEMTFTDGLSYEERTIVKDTVDAFFGHYADKPLLDAMTDLISK
jgi:hypothetical protein